jgi:hypothetical protein
VNYVCNVQVEKLDVTAINGRRIEETILVACGWTAPVDEIGSALMTQHLLDAHGVDVRHRVPQ